MAGKKEYIPLLDEELYKAPNADMHGVYIIHWIASNNKGKTICRVAGKDEEGILYIGEAHDQTLIKRISNFIRAVDPDLTSDNHSGGKSYNASKALKLMIKPSEMGVRLIVTAKKTPEKAETELLRAYQNQYGELPPLNNKIEG